MPFIRNRILCNIVHITTTCFFRGFYVFYKNNFTVKFDSRKKCPKVTLETMNDATIADVVSGADVIITLHRSKVSSSNSVDWI